MLFAMTFEQTIFGMLLLFMLGFCGIFKALGRIDTDGTVKDAARKGIVNVIGRLFK
jgi:hypothetical protein